MNANSSNKKKSKSIGFKGLLLHIHPPTITADTLKFTHTWGLGGMSLVLVSLLAITGILMLFVYEPIPGRAYDSIISLQTDVLFGRFVRNIHHWSGNILVITAFLHLLRVFFTGAFHGLQRVNWIIGLCLFFLILASNFTGYLLPWDQLAYWAVTICISMLEYLPIVGGWLQKIVQSEGEVGAQTLSVFFAFHISVIPASVIILLPFHFWRVRKSGGIVLSGPPSNTKETKPQKIATNPNLVLREVVVGLCLIAFILVFALVFDAPLLAKANPGLSPNPAKAPWYFSGIQELLMHFHPAVSVWVIPFLAMCALLTLPFMDNGNNKTGIWFRSSNGRQTARTAAFFSLIFAPLFVISSTWFVDFTGWLPDMPRVVSNGFLPLTIILGILALFYMVIIKKYQATRMEAVQAIFVFLLVFYAILTITGIWFRGPGMELVWPW